MILREEIIGDCRLLLGDCRKILPTLGRVDAVVTDPPYGIGYVHSGKSGGRWHRSNTKPIHDDDKNFDPSPLLKFSNVLMWGADHFASQLPSTGRFLAWNKLGDLPAMGDSFGNVEFAWHSVKGKADIFNLTWKGIIRIGSGEQGDKRHHPSQKPIALMKWCIEQVGGGDIILDPYLGSGTTGVAAMAAGKAMSTKVVLTGFDAPLKIRFDTGKSEISAADNLKIKDAVVSLTNHKGNLVLIGYASKGGGSAVSQELTSRRLLAVAAALDAEGFSSSRIAIKPPVLIAFDDGVVAAEARIVEIRLP